MERRELEHALRQKLQAEQLRGKRDHIFLEAELPNGAGTAPVRVAKFSHSQRGTLDDYVISDIYRRMRMTKDELNRFVACDLDGTEAKKLYAARLQN